MSRKPADSVYPYGYGTIIFLEIKNVRKANLKNIR